MATRKRCLHGATKDINDEDFYYLSFIREIYENDQPLEVLNAHREFCTPEIMSKERKSFYFRVALDNVLSGLGDCSAAFRQWLFVDYAIQHRHDRDRMAKYLPQLIKKMEEQTPSRAMTIMSMTHCPDYQCQCLSKYQAVHGILFPGLF